MTESTPSTDDRLHIVQIAPDIAAGSGVAGVAAALEREFRAAGARVDRFTRTESGGRPPRPGRLSHAWDVVRFSTIGTRRARRFLATNPEAVSICHNDALVGDVYVNHGLLQPAMRARGGYVWRMVRNPLHLYTAARDRVRYRGSTHRRVVALTEREAELLVDTYGRVSAPIVVIPNGVDIERFRPPSAAERAEARRVLNIDRDAFTAVFVGHEFDRKGLPLAIAALRHAPTAQLLVVGGDASMIARTRAQAADAGVADRIAFAGALPDPVPALWASDALLLPSAYEANALVLLEALACGIPIIATDVGAARELVGAGGGTLVARDAEDIARALDRAATADPVAAARSARAIAEQHAWPRIAARYLELARELRAERETTS